MNVAAAREFVELNVEQTIAKYVDGERYFEVLDEKLRCTMFLDFVVQNVIVQFVDELYNARRSGLAGEGEGGVVLSGRFGCALREHCRTKYPDIDEHLVLVNGGLRHGEPMLDMSRWITPGMRFLFVDDSYFEGRTRHVIQNEIVKWAGCWKGLLSCMTARGARAPRSRACTGTLTTTRTATSRKQQGGSNGRRGKATEGDTGGRPKGAQGAGYGQ